MKKFKFPFAFLLLFVSTAITSSCSDDNEVSIITKKAAFTTAVVGDAAADVNEEITLNVTFTVDNNCGSFFTYDETTAANVKTITVVAQYEGQDCGTTPTTKTAAYKFKATVAGSYTLKFKKSATEFITHTVVVE